MKLIETTLGYSAIVDDADFEQLSKFRWYAHNNCRGTKRPARRTSKAEGRKVLFLVHHIMKPASGFVVDHINGDPWDNRRENLRICTHAENLKNQHRKPRGELLKGVHRRSKRFVALIACDGVRYDLGSYDSVEEAAKAYDAAALFLHGEYACLNFPDAGTIPRRPDEIRAAFVAASAPIIRGGEPAAEVIRLMREGHNAKVASEVVGVPHRRAWAWAKQAGIPMRAGRPRKAAA